MKQFLHVHSIALSGPTHDLKCIQWPYMKIYEHMRYYDAYLRNLDDSLTVLVSLSTCYL